MTEKQDDIQKLSPDKLLQGFNKTPLLVFILAALGLHLMAFGVDYVAKQMYETPASDANAVDANTPPDANEPVDANEPADANAPAEQDGEPNTPPKGDDDKRIPDHLTDTAPAPKEPGLDLGDTN